jgi:hypothetical protein
MPLFHQHTLAPMLEAATTLVQAYCEAKEGTHIVGYYHGNELMTDHSVHPVAAKIVNTIQVSKLPSLIITSCTMVNTIALCRPISVGLQLCL